MDDVLRAGPVIATLTLTPDPDEPDFRAGLSWLEDAFAEGERIKEEAAGMVAMHNASVSEGQS